jgi:ribosome biogenesis GTPase
MDPNERLHLRKKAQKIRKDIQSRAPKQSRHDDSDGPPRVRSISLEDVMLRLLEQEDQEVQAVVRRGPITRGQLVWLSSQRCKVKTESGTIDCLLASDLVRNQQSEVAVGDCVVVELPEDSPPQVFEIEPRVTKLSRRDPGNRHMERIVAANIDVVGIVVAVGQPPLHPRLIDRYLIATQYGGAQPLLCVNKVDTLTTEWEQEVELSKLLPYDHMGLPIVLCSAAAGFGIDELRARLEGKLGAFVGHSGVGKSSLLNALAPDLNLNTGEVSEGYGRGTHTTTASTLHELDGGLRIIDTPGIRSFGLWDMSRDELRDFFPEFAPHAENCKFRDCAHDQEPKCGVRQAVEDRRLSEARYDTYLRVLEELG